jgi:hypothetical protein
VSQAAPGSNGAPGPLPAEVNGLLEQAEADLAGLEQRPVHDQVGEFDRIHESLVQALARTTDAAGPAENRPVPGRPGA